MLLKKAKYKKVKVWSNKLISDEIYGCDNCNKVIEEYPNEVARLTIDVWDKENDSNVFNYHFCSWKCLLKFIPSIKSEYFATMPYLHYNEGIWDRTATELINIIKVLK